MTTIVTHNGHFHADELLATAALLMKFPDATIIRTRDLSTIAAADIVVDVGHVYDSAKMRFDHHQAEGAGSRENGIPYASFGLVWKEFGQELAGGAEEAAYVEQTLVMPVDALDNGVKISTPLYENVEEYTIGDFFESFAFGADSLEEAEREFFVALPVARELLTRKIRMARTKVASWQEVRRIYEASPDKRVIVLPAALSWKKVLIPSEALYVIWPRTDNGWNVRAIPRVLNGFEVKKRLPASWGAKDNGELGAITGVADAVFCHRDLWLASAKSREGALKLAQIALEA
jgi:uncharacterized UPF0160 family protein